MSTLSNKIHMITTGTVLALGIGAMSSALASPVFTINPNSLTGVSGGTTFSADFVQGGSSARITQLSGNTYQSQGFITYTGFTLSGNPVAVSDSLLGFSYGIYATFTQTFACSGLLGPGVGCAVTGINLSLYADTWAGGHKDVFGNATLASAPTITNNGTDILLATADTVYAGLAGINALGGAYENVTTNFMLTTPAGDSYFIDPVPFYTISFSEFNNTSSGIKCDTAGCVNATIVAITNESGGSDFNKVPEPATLALMALGLLGMGGIARNRKL